MKSYKQLEEEFEKDVEELQKHCLHNEFTWMEEWWAPGHTTGYKVMVCNFCNKVLEKKKIIHENGTRDKGKNRN